MAQVNRIHGKAIVTFTFNSIAYVAVCENAEVSMEVETADAHALLDAWKYPIGTVNGWQVTGTFFISTAAGGSEGGPGGFLWTPAIAGTSATLTVKDNATATAGNTLSGTAFITSISQSLPTGPQTIQVTFTGQGALTSTIA